ncbi:MAG: hypothetical protein JJU28_18760 [Cyclobacteriaceae bacterium]|nr:hypothetical protein [Cyclobacteriaceae bacterium]
MKTKQLILITALSMGVITSCYEESPIEQINEEKKVKKYLEVLPEDRHFQDLMNSLSGLSGFDLNEDYDEIALQGLKELQNYDEISMVIKQNFKEPHIVLNQLDQYMRSLNNFRQIHSEFYELEYDSREFLILELFSNHTFYQNSQARVNGICEDQLSNDKQNCFEAALVAAGVCGLFTPTLIGALACGAGVIAADAVCHRAAERNYNTCKKYQ